MAVSVEKILDDSQEIKIMEIEAQFIYKELLPSITDERDREMLQGIIKDEERHEQIAQQMIDLLKT
jgi:rubrerythrin